MCLEELKGRGDDKCDEHDHRPITTQAHCRGPWESHENCGCLWHIEDSYSHQATANDSIIEVCFLIGRTKNIQVCTQENKKKQKANQAHQGGSKF